MLLLTSMGNVIKCGACTDSGLLTTINIGFLLLTWDFFCFREVKVKQELKETSGLK